ncbi:MAG: hypothetical protein ABGY95_06295 [Rubritalea sp.]|uniref:hypothetical protein n=1 Tax=Rubritalea sp. TaxID=2109375 RepID=UPI003242BC41
MKKLILSVTLTSSIACSSYAMEVAPFQTGYLYDFAADVDGGGDISKHFFHISGGVPLYSDDETLVALTASYQLHSYNFTGGTPGSFVGISPWDNIHTTNVGAFLSWKFADNWKLFAIPNIRSSGESGAKFGDSISGGALLGASYKFSDTLTMGPGVGYIGQLEDSASIFPILVVDWQFCENLSLTTGPIVGASLGPGISVKWKIKEDLRFTFGGRSERLRFRLDDSITNGKQGIGEDNSITVFGVLTWQATDNIQTSLIAGVGLANDVLLDNSEGNRITREDYDPSPFIGINLGYSF